MPKPTDYLKAQLESGERQGLDDSHHDVLGKLSPTAVRRINKAREDSAEYIKRRKLSGEDAVNAVSSRRSTSMGAMGALAEFEDIASSPVQPHKYRVPVDEAVQALKKKLAEILRMADKGRVEAVDIELNAVLDRGDEIGDQTLDWFITTEFEPGAHRICLRLAWDEEDD